MNNIRGELEGIVGKEWVVTERDGKRTRVYQKAKKEIYKAGVSLGGVITGEHGIGKIRVKDLDLVLSKKEIELMRTIKSTFDPNNILNPREVVRQTDALRHRKTLFLVSV